MAQVNRTTLKSYFETGDTPTEAQFIDLIDSQHNISEDGTPLTDASAFATAAQGAKADSAQQPPAEGAFVDGDKTKLDSIEAGADVTDAANVAAAGAVMNTGNETVAGIKTFSAFPVTPSAAPTTDYQVANKKYVDDSITAAGGYTDENAQDAVGAMVSSEFTYTDATPLLEINSIDADKIDDSTSTNKFTTAADISKLAGIEAGADVTDTANVTAAGALMDSEVTNLAAVKAFDPTDYATAAQGALADNALQPSDIGGTVQAYSAVLDATTASFTTADESKLDGIEAGAEVNTINSTATGEPTGSDAITNVVSLTSAEYTAGSKNAATLYIITDA